MRDIVAQGEEIVGYLLSQARSVQLAGVSNWRASIHEPVPGLLLLSVLEVEESRLRFTMYSSSFFVCLK